MAVDTNRTSLLMTHCHLPRTGPRGQRRRTVAPSLEYRDLLDVL